MTDRKLFDIGFREEKRPFGAGVQTFEIHEPNPCL
jgi:hypothetical protein